MRNVLSIPEHTVEGGWVLGPRSRLLDVWTSSHLLMWAPRFIYRAHEITYNLEERISYFGNKKIRSNKFSQSSSNIFYDCRHDSTANIAHVLQNQIGVALNGLDTMGMKDEWKNLCFVVHHNTPKFALRLYETLGFSVYPTDSSVSGYFLYSDPVEFPSRSFVGHKLNEHASMLGLLDISENHRDPIFIARRGRRSLTNPDEIERTMSKYGYRTIYPEDLPISEQIQTIASASHIAGLHGAALGYLMFRNSQLGGSFIETFSSTYSNNWARAIASTKSMSWAGCMGEFQYRKMDKLNNGSHGRKFEADNYRIDPDAIEMLAKTVTRPGNLNNNIRNLCSVYITDN